MENRTERLWEWLKTACTGDCRVLGIPHNSNLSGGSAFEEYAWIPYTPATLRLRAWAEPLVEIHQIKGNSECYLGLGRHGRDLDALGRPLHGAQRSTSSCFRFNQSSSTFRRPISSSSPA